MVALKGPGVFLAAQVSKQGGSNDLTSARLDIDGRNVADLTFAAIENLGLTRDVETFLKSGVFERRLKNKEQIVNDWTEIRAGL